MKVIAVSSLKMLSQYTFQSFFLHISDFIRNFAPSNKRQYNIINF